MKESADEDLSSGESTDEDITVEDKADKDIAMEHGFWRYQIGDMSDEGILMGYTGYKDTLIGNMDDKDTPNE